MIVHECVGTGDRFEALTVGQLMSCPVLRVDADAELWEVRAALEAHGVHHLLVEDRGRIVGLISDRDVLRDTSPYADGPASQRRDDLTLRRHAFQVATLRLVTISCDASVLEAAALLLDRGISSLPVVGRDAEIVGVITTHDLLRGMLSCALPQAA